MQNVIDFLNKYMPEGILLKPWMLEVFLVVLATAIASLIVRMIIGVLLKQTRKTVNLWDDALLDALRGPLRAIVWIIGLTIAAEVSFIDNGEYASEVIINIRKVGIIGALSWVLLGLVSNMESAYWRQPGDKKIDRTSLSAITKLLRISVVITAILICLQTLGISVSGVMAAGGVGGLAIGFAAKDLLANFFGAVMIYMDKPFRVGDWVRSPDRDIEGTVEEIGWRLTRIRTFDKRPLYVPNSIFTTISVENPSRMQNRRIKETIGVRYDDMSQVRAIAAAIEKMLREHKDIDTTRTLFINLNGFGASSVDMLLYCFTKTTKWVLFHSIKQDVLLKIADIIETHGASIAFPTRTLHIHQEEGQSPLEVDGQKNA